MDNIEISYGMPLQIKLIKVLFDLKESTEEVTVFSLANFLAETNQNLQCLVSDKRKRHLFHVRIRKCLNALIKNNLVEKQTKKSATATNYNTYTILF